MNMGEIIEKVLEENPGLRTSVWFYAVELKAALNPKKWLERSFVEIFREAWESDLAFIFSISSISINEERAESWILGEDLPPYLSQVYIWADIVEAFLRLTKPLCFERNKAVSAWNHSIILYRFPWFGRLRSMVIGL